MSLLAPFEAECLVSKLKLIPIEKVGSSEWLSQHECLERLNISCHHAAQSKHDEFVVNEILTQDKLTTIIYNLISVEIWKQKVFPLIIEHINEQLSVKTYMTLYEEATLVSMLQILLYHSSAFEEGATDDDGTAMLELVDYCHRKLVSVMSGVVTADHFNCHLGIDDTNPPKKLCKQRQHLEFVICSCCVSIIRFITEHLSKASISVQQRVINTLDMLLLLVSLIDKQPWTKHTDDGISKFNGHNRFLSIESNNRFRLTKIEGELWLSVYNLLMDATCANKYELSAFRRNEILKLKPYLLPQIIDQLPMLKDLRRTLEELGIMNLQTSSNTALSNPLQSEVEKKLCFVEILPEFRENILSKDFKAIAKEQLGSTFNADDYADDDRKHDMEVLCRIYNNFDGIEDILMEAPLCAQCGHEAEKRCSRCKSEWYCSRQCQVKAWKKHKKMCDAVHDNRQNLQKSGNIKFEDNDCKEKNTFIKEVFTRKLKQ
mmetsp:Transcript_21835/g.35090  ORF Transcript_21835/g.35090 Transcript_21835/m.35090 type:complete len:488 (+) Transcript_21835:50-1513(+)